MESNATLEALKQHEITGAIAIAAGKGGLPRLAITTPVSKAEIYLHGAHVTSFQKNGELPVIWVSAESQYATDKAIRGGVPICFPWFGPRAGAPAHGFARVSEWHLAATSASPDGRVSVRFRLLENTGFAATFHGKVEYVVTVGDTLTMELHVTNTSAAPLVFEECLHTYFTVGEIAAVSIRGLKGSSYVDKVDGGKLKPETENAIRFNSEVDRMYLNTTESVIIEDTKLKRTIRVEKTGSASTVVWNPWAAKAKAMADFGDEEFRRMVCVESGNVAENQIVLAPGAASVLKVTLSTQVG